MEILLMLMLMLMLMEEVGVEDLCCSCWRLLIANGDVLLRLLVVGLVPVEVVDWHHHDESCKYRYGFETARWRRRRGLWT
jgi:hypothetical protein